MEQDIQSVTTNPTRNDKGFLIYLVIIIPIVISGFVSYNLLQNKPKQLPPEIQNNQNENRLETQSTFYYPEDDVSQEEKIRYFSEVEKRAINTTTIDINNCLPDPDIVKLITNKPFTIKNSDIKDREIQITEDILYTIPAKSQIVLIADFGKGTGIYDYRCDRSVDPVGIFIVRDP